MRAVASRTACTHTGPKTTSHTPARGANSATNSAKRGVASRCWLAPGGANSLKTQRPALACAGRVRLEGCCSIHLSYGRRVRLAI